MKVSKAQGFTCDTCNEFFETKVEAEAHMEEQHSPNEAEWYRCGECDAVHEEQDDARECCKAG